MYDTKQTIEQVTDFAKKATALGFYKQYRVSAELGSQIAGMMEKEFIDYLEENGVSVLKKRKRFIRVLLIREFSRLGSIQKVLRIFNSEKQVTEKLLSK